MLCGRCLGALEYAGSRTRRKRYTGEDGPAVETIVVAVGHCLEDGHYATIFPDDVVRDKQYCISDIRSVLENKEDFSLASPRTRAYWRSWFRSVWAAVVRNLRLCIGGMLGKKECFKSERCRKSIGSRLRNHRQIRPGLPAGSISYNQLRGARVFSGE